MFFVWSALHQGDYMIDLVRGPMALNAKRVAPEIAEPLFAPSRIVSTLGSGAAVSIGKRATISGFGCRQWRMDRAARAFGAERAASRICAWPCAACWHTIFMTSL